MSNFKEHIQYGWLAHAAGTLLLLPIILLGVPIELFLGIVGVALPVTLFASVVPDIDHPSSRTYRLFKFLLFCTVVVLAAVTLGQHILAIGLLWLTVLTSVPYALILGTIGGIAVGIGALSVHAFAFIRPAHRGPTHNLLFGLFVSLLVGGLTWQLYTALVTTDFSIVGASLVAFYFFLGFCSHLRADGLLFQPVTSNLSLPDIPSVLRRPGTRRP